MWDITTWWLVGAVGLVFTAISLFGFRENIVALFVADAAAVLLWIVWSINAFAVEQTTQCCGTVVRNYPSLGYLGFAFVIVVMLDLFVSVFESLARRRLGRKQW